MKKLALVLAFLIGSIASASAACVGPIVMHDFPGTSFNMSVVTAPTGANDCQSNVAVPTWAGGTLGAMAAYGTSPGAVLVPGVNAFVTNTLNGITMGDAIAAGSFPTGSPVFSGLFNGTSYDRPRSGGVTGMAGVNLQSSTLGGCTPAKTLSAATTNSTSIKGSVGTLCKMITINTTATLYYLKMYNTAAAPTCNSDTVVATYPVPPSNGGVAVNLGPFGEAYTAGIGFCLTANLADNDNTAAATGVTISYSSK